MKRWRRIALHYLALGAILNVLIAWACALWLDLPSTVSSRAAPAAWPLAVPAGWPMPRGERRAAGPGLRLCETFGHDGPSSLPFLVMSGDVVAGHPAQIGCITLIRAIEQFSAGWPFPALSWTRWLSIESGDHPPPTGLEPPRTLRPRAGRRLPLAPLWRGFAANTLLFAGALAAPLLASRSLRRAHRRRALRCVHCGYDLRGVSHPLCPECGRPA